MSRHHPPPPRASERTIPDDAFGRSVQRMLRHIVEVSLLSSMVGMGGCAAHVQDGDGGNDWAPAPGEFAAVMCADTGGLALDRGYMPPLQPTPANLVELHGQYPAYEDLVDALGTIDTPQEAALLAAYAGYTAACGGNSGTLRVRPDGLGGFDVNGDDYGGADPSGCGTLRRLWLVNVDPDGILMTVQDDQVPGACEGRRPPGLLATRAPALRDATALGRHFARMAHMEAASVPAFERIAAELRSLGAPRYLVDAALRAAGDEVAHAHATAAMARRFGAEPPAVHLRRVPRRDLYAFALDNAVEGQVHETHAALRALHAGRCATDPAIRRMMARIGDDESRHAALAAQIARWVAPRLDRSARTSIAIAQRHALSTLRRQAGSAAAPAPLIRRAGVPTPDTARRLTAALAAATC